MAMTSLPRRRAAILLGALPGLAGCKLVDRTDFRPPPPAAPAVAAAPRAPAPPPAPPLLTVTFDHPGVAYADAVRGAARDALRVKPDVRFEVVALAPSAPTLDAQAAGLRQADADARGVAEAIARAGAAPDRISLSARTQPGLAARQVQVFVR